MDGIDWKRKHVLQNESCAGAPGAKRVRRTACSELPYGELLPGSHIPHREVMSHRSISMSDTAPFSEMAREIHGPDYDPSTQDLDGEVVMRVGGGKKHVRYWIGDITLDTASTPTLSQIRARSTSSSPAIRPRPDTTQSRMEALQAQLEEERRLREEMAQKMEEDRQRMEAERQRMEQMFHWMQSLGERMGQPMSPMLFPSPPPPASTPNQSAGSNNRS